MELRKEKGLSEINENVISLLRGFVDYYEPKELGEITFDKARIKEEAKILKLGTLFPLVNFVDGWDNTYDVIYGILPFGFNNKKLSVEEQIIEKSLTSLKKEGVLCVIVPESFCTSSRFEKIRKNIIKNYSIDAIVDIPEKKLSNSTSIKSSLIVIRNGESNSKCYMGELEGQWTKQLDNYKNHKGDFWVENTMFINRLDRSYHHPSNDKLKKYLDDTETCTIGELCEVIMGLPALRDLISTTTTSFPVLSRRLIRDNKIELDEGTKYFVESAVNERYKKTIPQEGDIIVSLDVNLGTLYSYQKNDPKVMLGQGLAILRPKGASGEYIKSYLSFKEGRDMFAKQADMKATGSVIRRLSIGALKAIKIPIIPLNNLTLNKVSDKNIELADKNELRLIKEELSRVLKSIEEKSSEILDFSKNRFDKVDAKLEVLDSKVDEVLKTLSEIQSSIEKIKLQPREDDEKIRKIYRTIDSKLNSIIDSKTFDDYIDDIKDWFEYWEFLDEASKSFLPSAEYLFDEIHHIGSEDYSPFIIQYCRALENELLKKMFEAYHEDINQRFSNAEIKELVSVDITTKSKAIKFASSVSRDYRKYTLGEMNFILALTTPSGSTFETSKLLKDFRNFILKYYDKEIIEQSYLKQINVITTDYRNKSAHPYIMGLDLAKECQILIRNGLIGLFEKRN